MTLKVTGRQNHQFLSEYLYTTTCESTSHDGVAGGAGMVKDKSCGYWQLEMKSHCRPIPEWSHHQPQHESCLCHNSAEHQIHKQSGSIRTLPCLGLKGVIS